MRIPSKCNNRADICRIVDFFLKCCSCLFSVIYHRSCQTNTCHEYLLCLLYLVKVNWLQGGHYRATRCFIKIKCYSSNMLQHWLQAKMWEKHFAKSIVIIGKWNEV